MKHLKLVVFLLSILCIASAACGEKIEKLIDEGGKVENPPESLQLEYKFDVGETRKYDMTIFGGGTVKLPGQKEESKLDSRTELIYVQHVKAYVPDEGIWRMEWYMYKGVMTLEGFGDMVLTIPSLNLEMDRYGTVKKMKGIEELEVTSGLPRQKTMADILTQLKSVGFPKKALSLGDTWEEEYKLDLPDEEPVNIKVKSELVGFERIFKMNCAKIHTTYEAPFSLALKDEEDSAGAGDSGTPTGAKPAMLAGTEKGDFWTYFVYEEGKIYESYGVVELTGDVRTEGAVASESSVEPAEDTHDLDLKFEMVSKLKRKPAATEEENQ